MAGSTMSRVVSAMATDHPPARYANGTAAAASATSVHSSAW
jgi:hypothetical protein